MKLTVRVLRGKAQINALAADWRDLFSRATSASAHLSPAWLGGWIESSHLQETTLAIAAWESRQLVALLILRIRMRYGLRFAEPLGTGIPSYLGLLLDPRCRPAAREVAQLCVTQRLFHVLVMHDVRSDDLATQSMLEAFDKLRSTQWQVPRAVCWRIRLDGSYETYLNAQTSGKRRAKLRWEERQLQKEGKVVVEKYSGSEVTDAVLERITRIQESSWMMRRGAVVFRSPLYRRLFLNLAETGLARAWLMTIDGQDAAFVLGIAAHGQLDYAYTAFALQYERLSIGKVLTAHVIRDACAEGVMYFDFGHGDADYKRFWANDSQIVSRAFVGCGLRGKIAATAIAAAWRAARYERLRKLARRVMGRSQGQHERNAE